MKVLFVSSLESDYLQDSVYSGLADILGKESVWDYPFHFSYHIKKKVYPRNLGYQKLNWSRLPQAAYRSYFVDYNHLDLVIVASCKPETFQSYLKIMRNIPSSTPIVFLDGGDRPEIGGDLDRLGFPRLYTDTIKIRPFDFVFKREYLEGSKHPSYVFPFPFAINPNLFAGINSIEMKKEFEVSFWAVESDPIRTKALDLISNQWDCEKNGTTRNQSFRKYSRKGLDYLRALAACKVSLNFRGVGWDTLRYWEVTSLGGFLISQKPQIVIPDNFRHGQEIVFCKDDLSDLCDLIKYYLENENERQRIAQNAFAWSKKYHTHTHRAQTLLKTCGFDI